ncbi:methyltransferase domain-containing protein [Lophiostoma macrostomum CBS 122681]|uniref:Methyltransferase domain-containing protein n=1 Tax=Lophiostoma macrostomum CBS 122681 TaxID=1314788 RepID=A0A6A6SJD7_9PLEO|nr:methyltransferase domain-containing protein [Lophiostoma macrostomum CBS 122681]
MSTLSKLQEPAPEDLKDRMKDSYDAIAEHYNTNFTRDHDPIRLKYTNILLDHLSKASSTAGSSQPVQVLELGFGAGSPITRLLLDNPSPRIHVTGNDISTTQLELAKRNLTSYVDDGRLKLTQGDMLALSFEPGSLTAILGFYSIIHLPRPQQTLMLEKVAKWLKPGGFFLANFSEEEMESNTVQQWLGQEKGWMFWSGWGVEGTVKMVKESGLEVLVEEIVPDVVDANFLWILAKRPEGDEADHKHV